MDEKEKIRKEMLEQQREETKEMAKQKQLEHELKIQEVFQKNEALAEQRRLEFEERQQKTDAQKALFDSTRAAMLEERKEKAREKQEEIERIILQNEMAEEAKKQNYLEKCALADKRKAELEEIKNIEKEEQLRLEADKEEHRKEIMLKNQQRLEEKINEWSETQAGKEERMQQIFAENKHQNRLKQFKNYLIKKDREENVARIGRQNCYILDMNNKKIQVDNEKCSRTAEEKANMMKQRFELKKEIDGNRQDILKTLEMMNLGKISPEVFHF